MAGNGAVPEDGRLMDTEKLMDLPASDTLIVSVFPEKEAVTEDGLGGRVPVSYRWNSWLSSCWRQVQSALVVTREPFRNLNGSGSFAFETRFILAGRLEQTAEDVGVVVGVVAVAVFVSVFVFVSVTVFVGVEVGVVAVVGPDPGMHWK